MSDNSKRKGTPPKKAALADKTATKRTLVTWKVPNELLEKVRDLSYWNRESVSEIFRTATEKHITEVEKEKGKIKPRPKDKRD